MNKVVEFYKLKILPKFLGFKNWAINIDFEKIKRHIYKVSILAGLLYLCCVFYCFSLNGRFVPVPNRPYIIDSRNGEVWEMDIYRPYIEDTIVWKKISRPIGE